MKYTTKTLPEILAQIVEFAYDDYEEYSIPEDVMWNVAYIVASFTAQHTAKGDDGVETVTALEGLRIAERMEYKERLVLAKKYVKEWTK
jgi:hypothetical protein